jgi:hypothetical protein
MAVMRCAMGQTALRLVDPCNDFLSGGRSCWTASPGQAPIARSAMNSWEGGIKGAGAGGGIQRHGRIRLPEGGRFLRPGCDCFAFCAPQGASRLDGNKIASCEAVLGPQENYPAVASSRA